MDHGPRGYSVHGILQARMLDRVTISFSRGSSWAQGSKPRLLGLLHCRQTTAAPLEKPTDISEDMHIPSKWGKHEDSNSFTSVQVRFYCQKCLVCGGFWSWEYWIKKKKCYTHTNSAFSTIHILVLGSSVYSLQNHGHHDLDKDKNKKKVVNWFTCC